MEISEGRAIGHLVGELFISIVDRGDEGAPRWKRMRYSDMVLSTYTVSTDDDHVSFAFESTVYRSLEILLPDIAVCIFYNQLDVPTNAYSIPDDRFQS